MFGWASSHIEKLTNTLAPPPEDAAGRFCYACQRGDEATAFAIVQNGELSGAGTIVKQTKQQVPIHVACEGCMSLDLIRLLLQQPGASIDVLDGQGNTPLHCACMSTCSDATKVLALVKAMVQEFQASVVAKNAAGQTPYDVATSNGVRQYLLPIQLQKETQEALDNGGAGLPPGIDLGGLRIKNSHLPPPPVGGMAPPSMQPGGGGPPPAAGVGMAPPPVPMQLQQQQQYPVPAGVPAPVQGMAPQPATPTTPATNTAPGMFTTPSPTPHSVANPAPALGDGVAPPPAPSSGGYALTGHSSAAIYKPPKGGRMVMPDGFHSSSSDKRLQAKYGHAPVGPPGTTALPPPPSSGNSPAAANSPHPASAPPSLNYYQANPYAGGVSALGGPNRQANRRYVAIDPVTGQPMAPPPAAATQYSQFPTPPPAANFTMFSPTGPSTASPAAAPVPTPPGPATTTTTSAPAPFMPPPAAGATTATASAPAASPYMPPPPYQTTTSPSPVPAAQPASSPTKFVPPPASPSPVQPVPFGANLRSNSTDSAHDVFSTSPDATETPKEPAAPVNASSAAPRGPLFSPPAILPGRQSAPASGNASEVFASMPQQAPTSEPASAASAEPAQASTPVSEPADKKDETEGEEVLQDVPLSPDLTGQKTAQPSTTTSSNEAGPAPGSTASGTDPSLYASIGMPPPPFSRK